MNRPARTALTLAALVGLTGTLAACGGDVLALEVGDCVNQSDLQDTEVSSVTTLECSEPHDAEIFGAVTHDDGDFPGEDEVKSEAQEGCITRFEEFVGVPYVESEIYFSTLSPSEQSWNQADDRTSLCIILAEEKMTGSLEGANR
ncbi:septum formation family protein [Georgenia subflava]|uniref:Septum formation family protein n=1 Tax=Georgenia subflava TaxID=1622177 RepID=A0A6N7EIG7_9MICO|nr:septum formation family protein [Georgenia subflava]MPV37221.1 septum formation family protein [Georgenia subflava]